MQFGFWSVVPPLLTIVLALVTKNVFISLLIGIFVGSMVLCSGALLAGLNETFYSFIHTFESNSNTIVLASFLLIGALIYPRAHQVQARRKPFHVAARHHHLHLRLSQLHGDRLHLPPVQ